MWEVSVLQDLIYSAVTHPESWPKILEELAKIAKAKAVTLTLQSKVISEWFISENYKPILTKAVNEVIASERNGKFTSKTTKQEDHFTNFSIINDVVENDHQNENTNRDVLYPISTVIIITTSIKLTTGEVFTLNLYRTAKLDPTDNELVTRLQEIRPHLVRSISISSQVALAKIAEVMIFIDSLGYAAFALSKDGKIILENQKSRIEKNNWRNRNGISLSYIDTRSESILNDNFFVLNSDNGVKLIPLFSEKNDEVGLLNILPFTHFDFTEIRLIGVISKTKKISENIEALLQIIFNLTKAEAIISIKFFEGKTANEIAAETEKSVHTIRNQINSILQKTGCRRQSDLSHMLARLTTGAL